MSKDITHCTHYTVKSMLTSIAIIILVAVVLEILKIENGVQIIDALGLLSMTAIIVASIAGKISDKMDKEREAEQSKTRA